MAPNAGKRTAARSRRTLITAVAASSALLITGCSWDGLNSLPLPGAIGTGSSSYELIVQIGSVGTLTQNSPVMIDDVTVGSIRKLTVNPDWTAKVVIGLAEGTEVPRGTRAMVGQVSLLGSQFMGLIPPKGVAAEDAPLLQGGDTISMSESSTAPSTESTLSTLSVVLNGGGLAQLNDITTELNAVFDGNQESIHDLLPQLESLTATLDRQKGDIVLAMEGVNRLSSTVRDQDEVLVAALQGLAPATQVLANEKDNLAGAIMALGKFSGVADDVLTRSSDDLRANLASMGPILSAVADTGDALPDTLSLLFTFPFPMETLFNAMRGDYTNLWDEVDLTGARLNSSLFVGSNLYNSMGGPDAIVGQLSGNSNTKGDPFNPKMPTPDQVEDESAGQIPELQDLFGPLATGADE
ncbi:MCE family protein [Tomitella biformata]|uniref:MCE family protein n=1 Tax=Tomitella biformata TaxID=630403 RepID=UPI000464C35C|nr:MCE family protein [Tomitella biformata]